MRPSSGDRGDESRIERGSRRCPVARTAGRCGPHNALWSGTPSIRSAQAWPGESPERGWVVHGSAAVALFSERLDSAGRRGPSPSRCPYRSCLGRDTTPRVRARNVRGEVGVRPFCPSDLGTRRAGLDLHEGLARITWRRRWSALASRRQTAGLPEVADLVWTFGVGLPRRGRRTSSRPTTRGALDRLSRSARCRHFWRSRGETREAGAL
jgi:hypothetical protein